MPRVPAFNSPFLLGFDEFERALERISKVSSDGYPPYNVEEVELGRLRITLAVAGFGRDALSVTIENNELLIAGRLDDDGERHFLHRGIASRQFQRRFVLADGLEVSGASLENGLLHVDLVRPKVAADTRTVEIKGGGRTTGGR